LYQSRDQLEHNEAVSSKAILAGSSVGQVLIIILRIVFGVALIAAGVVALGIGISAATISTLHLLIAGAVPSYECFVQLGIGFSVHERSQCARKGALCTVFCAHRRAGSCSSPSTTKSFDSGCCTDSSNQVIH
jgi:hypothetical protein